MPDVVTVPETAVVNTLYGDSVYVVQQDGTDGKGNPVLRAKRVPVKTGERFGNRIALLSGVDAGARVVALGQNKVLFDGAPVAPSGRSGLVPPPEPPKN